MELLNSKFSKRSQSLEIKIPTRLSTRVALAEDKNLCWLLIAEKVPTLLLVIMNCIVFDNPSFEAILLPCNVVSGNQVILSIDCRRITQT